MSNDETPEDLVNQCHLNNYLLLFLEFNELDRKIKNIEWVEADYDNRIVSGSIRYQIDHNLPPNSPPYIINMEFLNDQK